MDAQQAKLEIQEAILKIESGDQGAASAGFQFLNNVPHTYATVVDAFRPGLQSDKPEVKISCILAVGRLGRNTNWAVEELSSILNDDTASYGNSTAAAFALGSLQTIPAADALAGSIRTAFWDMSKDDSFPMDSALNALANMGGLANDHRELFLELRNEAYGMGRNAANFNLHGAHDKFTKKLREDFENFRKNGPGKKFLNEEFDPSALRCNDPIAKLRHNDIIFDDYVTLVPSRKVDLSGIPESERAELPDFFKNRPDIYGRIMMLNERSTGVLSNIVFQDACSSSSIINNIEEIAHSISTKLHRPASSMRWFTVTYGDSKDSLLGLISPVKLIIIDDKITGAEWGHGMGHLPLLGGDGQKALEYAAEHPFMPEGLPEYTAALRADQLVRSIYDTERFHSPEGRLYYEDMNPVFGNLVRDVLKGSVDRPSASFPEYGDSFDQDFLTVGPASCLPYPVYELVKEAMTTEQVFVKDEFFGLRSDRFGQPDGAPLARNDFDLDPLTVGIVLLRSYNLKNGNRQLVSNVPTSVFRSSAGYEWGYGGSGPRELALNILNLYIPPASDGLPETECQQLYWPPRVRTFASQTAVNLLAKFDEEIISRLPHGGAFISAEHIKDWIIANLPISN